MANTFIEKAQEKGITVKKLIKGSAIIVGIILIFFMTFFDAIIDPKKLNLSTWLTNSLTMLAIIVFGIVMGESVGQDAQQEKYNGLYQNSCADYNAIRDSIRIIDSYFTQWWLKHKERRLKEKKIDYLISNQFDTLVATTLVLYAEKSDMEIGKLLFDTNKPFEKIYVKDLDSGKRILFKKLDSEKSEIVSKIFEITLDTFEPDYYLSLFDEDISTNDVEKGKKIAKRIARNKLWKKVIRIVSSLVISAVWGMLTIKEFTDGGDSAKKTAWLNLFSRLTSLITSFASGYSTSVINVKLQSRAIQNKCDILTLYKQETDKKLFVPETYEQMVEREYREQMELLKKQEQPQEEIVEEENNLSVELETQE